jgi:hypothetical protein
MRATTNIAMVQSGKFALDGVCPYHLLSLTPICLLMSPSGPEPTLQRISGMSAPKGKAVIKEPRKRCLELAHNGHAYILRQRPILKATRTLPRPVSLGPVYDYTP